MTLESGVARPKQRSGPTAAMEAHSQAQQIVFAPVTMRILAESAQFSEGCDRIWMSQFLDCFFPRILKKYYSEWCKSWGRMDGFISLSLFLIANNSAPLRSV